MKRWLLGGAVVMAIAGAAIFGALRPHGPGLAPAQAGAPSAMTSSAMAPGATTPADVAPEDCLLPGPPPVPPNGATASGDDMKLGHDVMQAFVLRLEAYQACRNGQIDHAAAGVTAARKQIWLEQGNDAVDEANALAAAFGAQLRLFKDRNGGEAPQ